MKSDLLKRPIPLPPVFCVGFVPRRFKPVF